MKSTYMGSYLLNVEDIARLKQNSNFYSDNPDSVIKSGEYALYSEISYGHEFFIVYLSGSDESGFISEARLYLDPCKIKEGQKTGKIKLNGAVAV